MTQEKQNAVNAIEEKAGLIGDVADHIWEYAELFSSGGKVSCSLL